MSYLEEIGPTIVRDTQRRAPLQPNIDAIFEFCRTEIRHLFQLKIKQNNLTHSNTIIVNELENHWCHEFTDFTITRLMTEQGYNAITSRETLRLLMSTYIDHIISDLHRLADANRNEKIHFIVLRGLSIGIERKTNILSEEVTMEITYYVDDRFLKLVD